MARRAVRRSPTPSAPAYTIKFGSLSLNSVPSTNLADPNPHDTFAGQSYVSSITHTKSDSVGLYFVDTLHLGRYIEASGGIRWDYFDTGFNLYAPAHRHPRRRAHRGRPVD